MPWSDLKQGNCPGSPCMMDSSSISAHRPSSRILRRSQHMHAARMLSLAYTRHWSDAAAVVSRRHGALQCGKTWRRPQTGSTQLITMPSEENVARVACNMHRKFGEVWTYGSWDVWGQTDQHRGSVPGPPTYPHRLLSLQTRQRRWDARTQPIGYIGPLPQLTKESRMSLLSKIAYVM